MSNNIEAFVSTYQQCFPGTPTPPMPKKADELPLTTQLAIRDANPGLWQAMFAGHGERLPADVEARLLLETCFLAMVQPYGKRTGMH